MKKSKILTYFTGIAIISTFVFAQGTNFKQRFEIAGKQMSQKTKIEIYTIAKSSLIAGVASSIKQIGKQFYVKKSQREKKGN